MELYVDAFHSGKQEIESDAKREITTTPAETGTLEATEIKNIPQGSGRRKTNRSPVR